MKLNIPRYELVRSQSCETDWLFEESEEAFAVTLKFDEILERWRGSNSFTSELRKFLNRYPWHFDAMNHYASCKLDDGRPLEAFAFAQTAVSVARSAIPSDFQEGEHKIPGGFVQNRPFLRCLYQLMLAQARVGELSSATATGYQLLSYDERDRMGCLMELPKYLIQQGLFRKAITLFKDEDFEDSFGPAKYLYPLALIGAGQEDDARKAIEDCMRSPRIAKYILNPDLPMPKPELPFFGITMGSELEGFACADVYRPLWVKSQNAIPMLREAFQRFGKAK
jgi:tetratricopeptide (TPR) repeat protein